MKRNSVLSEQTYKTIDKGIRFAVRVLNAKGIDTQQSCQGGKGHAYNQPSVDIPATDDDAKGFAALSALRDYGLPVQEVSIIWPVSGSLPTEKFWRVTFFKTMEDRANEKPLFTYSY